MFTSRTSPQAIFRLRLEAEYYDPEKLRQLSWMNQWRGRLVSLEDLCKYITDGTHITPTYVVDGVRFLSSTNINACWVDFQNTKFISAEEHLQLGKAKCNPTAGDILLAKNGKIGTAATYRQQHEPVSLFVSVALLHYSASLDRDYVTAFLNSAGGWVQFSRSSKTGVITNLHLEEIREVMVPVVHVDVQRYIGEKVRQAEAMRCRVQQLQKRIDDLLAPFKSMQVPTGRTSRVASREVSDTLNANAYMAQFVQAYRIVEERRHKTIANLSSSVADGPFGSNLTVTDYRTGAEAVHPVVRVKNCEDGKFNRTDLVWIDAEKQSELARSAAIPGDLLVTKAGRIGSAAVYPEDLPTGNITSHLIRARIKPPIDAQYVAEFLETPVGRAITLRHSFKSTRPELTKAEIEVCPIPLLTDAEMLEIAVRSRTKNRLSEYSGLLVTAATLLVEAVIEGKCSEREIAEAQQHLDSEDRDLDRLLLNRLTHSGIDVADAPKLYPDVEAFYQSLDAISDRLEEPAL
jgi:hypothetical protein